MESSDLGQPHVPTRLQEPFGSAIRAATAQWCAEFGERLISVVLFGSVARGDATSSSDVDLVVVARGFPRSLRDRRRPLLDAWERARQQQGLPALDWNLVTKSPEEAQAHVPLYLDVAEDGILILDRDGFFSAVLSRIRRRMSELGSRRVYLDDGSWYWDLKPDFRFGEVVEI